MDLIDRAFAAVYDLVSPVAEHGPLGERRRRLLDGVEGHVLDLGAGVGANLRHLGPAVERVTLLEPEPSMARRLRHHVDSEAVEAREVEVIEAPGEAIPLPDDSIDVAVCTLVLCTVPDVEQTLRELRRVLRPTGTVAVLEHVRGEGPTALLQDTIRPVWGFFGGGCDPSRPTRRYLERAGFDTSEVESVTLTGCGPLAPAIIGRAAPR